MTIRIFSVIISISIEKSLYFEKTLPNFLNQIKIKLSVKESWTITFSFYLSVLSRFTNSRFIQVH